MRAIGATVLCLAMLLLFGCASAEEPPADSGTDGGIETPGPQEDPLEATEPGLYELSDGRVRAVGTLARVDLEGGFWALIDVTGGDSGQATDTDDAFAETVAVLANPDEFAGELAHFEGAYVAMTGTPFDGVSIRMAGPEVVADTIELIADSADEAVGVSP